MLEISNELEQSTKQLHIECSISAWCDCLVFKQTAWSVWSSNMDAAGWNTEIAWKLRAGANLAGDGLLSFQLVPCLGVAALQSFHLLPQLRACIHTRSLSSHTIAVQLQYVPMT